MAALKNEVLFAKQTSSACLGWMSLMEEGGLVCIGYDFGPYPCPLSQLGVGLALPPHQVPLGFPSDKDVSAPF